MYQGFLKRLLDIVVATSIIIILTIPLLLVAIWIKIDSKGPVLFRQLRSGKNRVPFTIYKFRSMRIDAPKNSPTYSLKDANSFITYSGRIIRKLSIDELPQLFNVIRGDMSIVGPRPVVLNETRLLDLREKSSANTVKPGITGWAQVNGRDELDDIDKARMDGYYVEQFSFVMDVRCLYKTAWTILMAVGHVEGHEQSSTASAPQEDLMVGGSQ